MPTVPYTPRAPSAPKIDETFAAMAAADLHEAGMLFEPQPTEAEMNRAKATMANRMNDANDPTEGDYLMPEKYNTMRAAEGIRKYEGDR